MSKTPVKKLNGVAFGFLTRKNPASLDEAKALLTLTYAPRVEVNDFPALQSIAERWWAKKEAAEAPPMRKVGRRRYKKKAVIRQPRKTIKARRKQVAPKRGPGRPKRPKWTFRSFDLSRELRSYLPEREAARALKAITKLTARLGGPTAALQFIKGLERLGL